MGVKMLKKVIGSKTLNVTTSENEEIIPNAPSSWSVPLSFSKFSFVNTEECHVILNGNSGLNGEENRMYLREMQGLNLNDVGVQSLVIVESGVHYNWIGEY